jgi:HK97 family phage portal protein
MAMTNFSKAKIMQTKAVTDIASYNQGAISILEGSGTHGAKHHPFNQTVSLSAFRSWAYAAASINAKAVSAVPLRLYVQGKRDGSGFKTAGQPCTFATRPVNANRKRRLLGETTSGPHGDVRRKLIEFGDFEEVTERHPILDLLSNVNPYLNGFDFTYTRMVWQQMSGNAYVMLYHGDGEGSPPTELWPMAPQWTWIQPSRENWIDGYVFGKNSAEVQEFARDEVIHFRMNPGVTDMFYGMGWAEAIWKSLALDNSNDTMDNALAENHGRPDYAVLMEGAQPDQASAMQASLDRRHKGSRKAGRAGVFAGPKLQIVPMTFPPKDMTGRDELVEKIASASGVPVSMLKANDPNLASATQGYQQWRESTITPMLRSDEQQLNQSFVPMFDERLVLAYDSAVPGDEERDARVNQIYVSGGIKTANEARESLNLEAITDDENADKLLVSGQPLGGVAMPDPASPFQFTLSQPATETTAPASVTVNNDSSVTASLMEKLGQMAKAIERLEAKADTHDEEPEQVAEPSGVEIKQSDLMNGKSFCCDEEHTKASADDNERDDENSKPSKVYAKAMNKIFTRQLSAIATLISKTKAGKPRVKIGQTPKEQAKFQAELDALLASFDDDIDSVTAPFMEATVTDGGLAGLAKLKRPGLDPFSVTNPRVADYLAEYSVKLRTEVQGFTSRAITDSVARGLESGLSPKQISANLMTEGPNLSQTRANAIARTESARGYVEGQQLAWQESGVVAGRKWLLAPGACEFCRAISKKFNNKVTPLDQPFFKQGETLTGTQGGKMTLDYSAVNGPPLHPNDRCDVVPVIND